MLNIKSKTTEAVIQTSGRSHSGRRIKRKGDRKAVLLAVCLIALAFSLSGCAAFVSATATYMNGIYDDDEKIAADYSSYSYNNLKQTLKDSTLDVSGQMTGMDTVWTFTPQEDTEISYTCTLTTQSGRAKLVLVAPDDTVQTLLEVDEDSAEPEDNTYTLPLQAGKNVVKLVCSEKTKFHLTITIEEGSLRTLGM